MVDSAPAVPQLLEELEGRWRALGPDDTRRATYLLGDAWREIARIPTLLERIASDPQLAADARMIACEATKRAMVAEGREGVEEEERTDGPIGRRRRYTAAGSSATIELTDDERSKLTAETSAEGAPLPRWTGDQIPTGLALPSWPRDQVGSAYGRRPW